MNIKKLALTAALGMSMASAPVMAQTASVERTGAVLEQASAQEEDGTFGGTTTYVIAFLVVVVIGLGIYFAIDDEGDGDVSP